jgi:trk system potassium uptake protein TrkH
VPVALRSPAVVLSWFRHRHPTQFVVAAFSLVILVGGALLMLPQAAESGESAPFPTALFTSASAVCITGLVVVDTPTYWSTFGEVVLMGLIQLGGLGIMTLASLLIFVLAGRLGLRGRLIAQTETAVPILSDVRRLVFAVAILSLVCEAVVATILSLRWWTAYDYSFGRSVYLGIFTAISSFNSAGFSLWSDSLVPFATDAWICVTVALAVIAGGLGFPVWIELRRLARAPRRWSLHTKLTLLLTALLVAFGTVAVLGLEWTNEKTLGQFSVPGKLLVSFFQGVTPRTAGFSTIDYGAMEPDTLLVTDLLMFIGAGSAGTGGGIKVTTFAVLALMVWAEIRGEPNLHVFGRRVPALAQRQALAVTLISLVAVLVGTLVLMVDSGDDLGPTLFEAISAFATTGLSTGITSDFSAFGRWILIVLMYIGRIGPLTLGVALALQEHGRRYRFPEERPIIG